MSVGADAALIACATAYAGDSRHIGLAVSGGSDSMAMLWLVAPVAIAKGIKVSVATVDHGLRPEARNEAQFVARNCAEIGVSHSILDWRGWDGTGNLQSVARDARRMLLTQWAQGLAINRIALAHTMDDQAETFLMRLARVSGVDGLSGMQMDLPYAGLLWQRPLLSCRRDALRDYLRRHGKAWMDDPSNADESYDRVRARKALALLAPLGIDAESLSATALRLSIASHALQDYARMSALEIATVQSGDVVFDIGRFKELPDETQLRLAAHAVCWVGGGRYRPRLISMQDTLALVGTSGRRSLQGTLLTATRTTLRISREPNAVRRLSTPTNQFGDHLWDHRWHLTGPHDPSLQIRALGDNGIRQCPDWRATGLPRQSLLASPAIWQGDTLIAVPLAGKPNGWTAQIVTSFHDSLNSH